MVSALNGAFFKFLNTNLNRSNIRKTTLLENPFYCFNISQFAVFVFVKARAYLVIVQSEVVSRYYRKTLRRIKGYIKNETVN